MKKAGKDTKLIKKVEEIPDSGLVEVQSVKKLGRPTKFHDGIPALTDAYVDECVENNVLPTLEGLACEFGVVGETIQDWKSTDKAKMKKAHKNFSVSIKRLLHKQAEMLQKNGLSGRYNTAMAIFLLKNNHGFKDRHEVDHTSDGERIESINYTLPEGSN